MVFEVAMFCSSWISANNTVPRKDGKISVKSVSLATEMTQRAKQAEEVGGSCTQTAQIAQLLYPPQVKRMQDEQQETHQREQEAKQASFLAQRIAQDVQQKRETLIRRESEQKKVRAEAMAVIDEESASNQAATERFDPPAEDDNGVTFDTVILSAGRQSMPSSHNID